MAESEPRTHLLKCWPEFYQPIVRREKMFDVRKGNDREYQVGDLLDLREWDPQKGEFTGLSCRRKITYVLHGPPILPDDYWVLSLSYDLW